MRTLRIVRLLVASLLLLAAILVVVVAVLFTVDLSAYRVPLEARVSRALGRPVTLRGAIHVVPSFTPTVTVRRVTMANLSWASHPLLAEAQQLSLQFRLWPLLRGHIVIDRVALSGAQVHLETRRDGTPNWILAGLRGSSETIPNPAGRPAGPFAEAPPPVAARPTGTLNGAVHGLPRIEVRHTQVDYRDGRSGVVTRLTVTHALLTADDPQPLRLTLDGTLRGDALHLVVVGGPWSELVRGVAPWPLRVRLEASHNVISAQGELHRLPQPRFDLHVHARGPAFAALARLAGARVPPLGPFELQGRLERNAEGYEITGAKGFLGRADAAHRFTVRTGTIRAPFSGPVALQVGGLFRGAPFELRMDGAPYPELMRQSERWPIRATVHIAQTHLSLDGALQPRSGDFSVAVQAQGALLSSLDPLLGRDLPALGPYSWRGRVLRERGVLGADAVRIRVGSSDARGSLRLNLSSPRPALSGELEAQTLNLADFRVLLAPSSPAAAAPPAQGPGQAHSPSVVQAALPPVAQSANAAPPGVAQAAPAALPWARRPLPLALLKRLDLHLKLRVGRVLGAGSSLEDVRGTLRLHHGELAAEGVSLRLVGQAITGHAALVTGGDTPVIRLTARAQHIRYGPVLAALHITQRLSGEARSLEVSLRGEGRTPLAVWRSVDLRLTAQAGDVAYRPPGDGAPVRFTLARASARLGGPIGLELDANGSYRDTPFRVHLVGDGLPELHNDSLPWHVRASGTLADASFGVVGSMRAPFSGRGVDLRVRLQGPHLAALGPPLGRTLPALGPYSLRGQLSNVPGGVRLQALQAHLGDSDASGELSIVGGRRPRIVGTLSSRTLRLADLLPAGAASHSGKGVTGPSAQVVASAQGRVSSPGKPGATSRPPPDTAGIAHAIPDVAFPTKSLRTVDLDLKLSATHLALGTTLLSGVSLQVRLQRGRLELRQVHAGAWQGQLSGSATLDASKTPPRVQVNLLAQGIDYQRALGTLDVAGIRPATAHVVVRLHGRGTDLHDALASAQGVVEFFGDEGQIDSRYLDLWASNMFLALLPSFGKEKAAHLQCAVGRFDVKDGQAHTRSLLVDTPRVVVKGVGSIDLRNERLDLLLWPEPREVGLRLTTPVRVTGTLSHPDVTPQARGVVEEVAWLLIGANNPFVLLLSYLKPNEVEANPCVAALAAVDHHGAQPENTPPTPISKTRDFFLGLGRFLERSFGGD